MKSLTAFVVAAFLCVVPVAAQVNPCLAATSGVVLSQSQMVQFLEVASETCGADLLAFCGLEDKEIINFEPVFTFPKADFWVHTSEPASALLTSERMMEFFAANGGACAEDMIEFLDITDNVEFICFVPQGKQMRLDLLILPP